MFRAIFKFIVFIFWLASLAGCATPKTETGALACRGAMFAINPQQTVQAEAH